mgnify:CR=1 FL=1
MIINGIVYTTGYRYRIPSNWNDTGANQQPKNKASIVGHIAIQYFTLLFFRFLKTVPTAKAGNNEA